MKKYMQSFKESVCVVKHAEGITVVSMATENGNHHIASYNYFHKSKASICSYVTS